MSLIYQNGDATCPRTPGAKIIVHVCNDKGGWGRGFVLAISHRWPQPEQQYRAWHRGEYEAPFALGEVQFVSVGDDTTVANLIGQHGFAKLKTDVPVRYDAIQNGLRKVADYAIAHTASVHMPRIGCGLAGGKWEEVEPIILKELVERGVPTIVYDFTVA